MKSKSSWCSCTIFFMCLFIVSLIGACGGGGDDSTATTSGVTVSTLKDIPEADVTNYLEESASSSLSYLTERETGAKWVEFCYMEQCLAETIRHAKEFDFFTCMMKAGVDDGIDIPASGETKYFEIIPPPFGEEGAQQALVAPSGSSNANSSKARAASIDTENFLVRLRLTKSGEDSIKLAMCEPDETGTYQQVEEFTIDNSSDQFTGEIRFNWNFGLEDEKGYMKLQTSCPSAESFRSGACTDPVILQNSFDGSFGVGGIDFQALTANTYTLVYDFAGQDDLGGGGSFEVDGKGKIGATKGCIQNQASGGFPAVPPGEVQWMLNIPGCASVVSNATNGYCFKEPEDEENIDFSAYCPMEPAPSTGLCSFSDSEARLECGNVTAGSIGKREGTIADTSDGSFDQLLTDLDSLESTASRDTSFQDPWDCEADSSGFSEIDMSTSAAAIACEEIFTELDGFDDGGESCDEQGREDSTEEDLQEGGFEGEEFSFDDEGGAQQEGDFEPDDEGFEGFDSCPFSATCSNDFQCQQFADEDLNDPFETNNVQCNTNSGCCELL